MTLGISLSDLLFALFVVVSGLALVGSYAWVEERRLRRRREARGGTIDLTDPAVRGQIGHGVPAELREAFLRDLMRGVAESRPRDFS